MPLYTGVVDRLSISLLSLPVASVSCSVTEQASPWKCNSCGAKCHVFYHDKTPLWLFHLSSRCDRRSWTGRWTMRRHGRKIRERTVAQRTDFALRCAALRMQYVTLAEITTRNIRSPDLFRSHDILVIFIYQFCSWLKLSINANCIKWRLIHNNTTKLGTPDKVC